MRRHMIRGSGDENASDHVSCSSPEPRIDPRLWVYEGEHVPLGSFCQILAILTLRRFLTPRSNMNAPIRDAFDCSSQKPMRRHFVSGFPRALLSLSQEKSFGVEIDHVSDVAGPDFPFACCQATCLSFCGQFSDNKEHGNAVSSNW